MHELAALGPEPADPVHAVRPNMRASCGWCSCGCEGNKHHTYVLRERSTRGVTCGPCLKEMEENPWPTREQQALRENA